MAKQFILSCSTLKEGVHFLMCETSEKNLQFNFSSQNPSTECNSFQWDGNVTAM